MGLLASEHKRRALLHSMAELARRTGAGATSTSSSSMLSSASAATSSSSEPCKSEASGESFPTIFPTATPMAPPVSCFPTHPSTMSPTEGDRIPPAPALRSMMGLSTSVPNLTTMETDDRVDGHRRSIDPGNGAALTSPTSDTSTDESIMFAVALLRRLQQSAEANAQGEAQVKRDEVDQILQGFSKALESVSTAWDEQRVSWRDPCCAELCLSSNAGWCPRAGRGRHAEALPVTRQRV
jgi:hypothetical protein